jgi:predicted glycoside hydrolase/deacetylase ChbG (UPF0249 family)
MKKELFVVADDYGVHNIIDTGIHKCIDAGTVDCADIIVTHESSKRRIKKLIKKYPDKIEKGELKLGLHLNLNVGGPANLDNDGNPDDPKFKEFLQLISVRPRGKANSDRRFRYDKVIPIVKMIRELQDDYLEFLQKEMEAQAQIFYDVVGRYPDHVSSHSGVYQGTEKIYRIYREFCEKRNILMRCPTLMIFDSEKKDLWKDKPKQKLFPMAAFIFLKVAPDWPGDLQEGAAEVFKWTKDDLKPEFESNVLEGLKTINYTVEHFYRNGSIRNLRKILDKIRHDREPNSYELVVHPAYWKNLSERDGLPDGINKGKGIMRDRKKELKTLLSGELRDAMNIRGIDSFKFPA